MGVLRTSVPSIGSKFWLQNLAKIDPSVGVGVGSAIVMQMFGGVNVGGYWSHSPGIKSRVQFLLHSETMQMMIG